MSLTKDEPRKCKHVNRKDKSEKDAEDFFTSDARRARRTSSLTFIVFADFVSAHPLGTPLAPQPGGGGAAGGCERQLLRAPSSALLGVR